jgi:hypothetical protein
VLVKLIEMGVWVIDLSPEPIYMGFHYTGGCKATNRSDCGNYVVKTEKNRYNPSLKSFLMAVSFDIYLEPRILLEGVKDVIIVGKTTDKAIGED